MPPHLVGLSHVYLPLFNATGSSLEMRPKVTGIVNGQVLAAGVDHMSRE